VGEPAAASDVSVYSLEEYRRERATLNREDLAPPPTLPPHVTAFRDWAGAVAPAGGGESSAEREEYSRRWLAEARRRLEAYEPGHGDAPSDAQPSTRRAA
jgi:hypothetical protein